MTTIWSWDSDPVLYIHLTVPYRLGYIPSTLMGPKSTESGEHTDSDLLCHLIHGLYPGRFELLIIAQNSPAIDQSKAYNHRCIIDNMLHVHVEAAGKNNV